MSLVAMLIGAGRLFLDVRDAADLLLPLNVVAAGLVVLGALGLIAVIWDQGNRLEDAKDALKRGRSQRKTAPEDPYADLGRLIGSIKDTLPMRGFRRFERDYDWARTRYLELVAEARALVSSHWPGHLPALEDALTRTTERDEPEVFRWRLSNVLSVLEQCASAPVSPAVTRSPRMSTSDQRLGSGRG